MTVRKDISTLPAAVRNAIHIVDNAAVPMFTWWSADKLLFYNEGLAKLLGVDLFNDSMHTQAMVSWFVEQLPASGSPNNRCSVRFPAGAANVSLFPVTPDNNKGVFGMVCTLEGDAANQSLIRKIEVEVQLRTSQLERQKRFVNSILDASFHAIYSLRAIRDPDGTIVDFSYVFINHVGAAAIGKPVEEIVGNRLLSLLKENRTNGFFDSFRRALETGESVQDETWFQSEQFSGWFNYIIVVMDPDTLVVTAQDITQQKTATLQIERQKTLLDTIISSSPAAIALCSSIRNAAGSIVDFEITIANQKAAELTGFSYEEFLSSTLGQIHRVNNVSDILEAYVQVVESGIPLDFEYYLQRVGLWFRVSVVKVKDGFLSVFHDITPVKTLQLEQEALMQELKRTNTNLEEFAYAASHDLKEPVRKIAFFVDHLRESLQGKLSQQEAYTFDRMTLAAKRMGLLIDDLLSYSQVSIGRDEGEPVDLNDLINVVLNDLDVEIEQKNARIEVQPLPWVHGNQRQLQQAFLNLISNALKYGKPGSPPEISVMYELVRNVGVNLNGYAADHPFHKITVRDNGIGFNQTDADKIFQVFVRLHGNEVVKGTGVGLSIVRKIVENHHGTIHAESKPGVGSAFTILLPQL